MISSPKTQAGMVVFSIIGALIIVGAAWFSKGSENGDTWLYILSIWMILFSVFQVRASVAVYKLSKLALIILVGASIIVTATWWANGAEHMWLFLTSVATMLVAFFILLPRRKSE